MATAPEWLQELYPTPWRVEPRGSRSMIVAKDGTMFANGMNNEKAVLIVIAVNELAKQTAPKAA